MCVALTLYGPALTGPLRGGRKLLQWCTYIGLAALTIWSVIINSTMFLSPWADVQFGIAGIATAWTTSIAMFLPLLCVAASIPAAQTAERRRLAWVFASFLPLLAGSTVANVSNAPIWYAVQNISYFFIPAGLTYAALARRMFDVAFVVNRTAVFGVVSTIVVGAFVLLEWALGKWFENASHTTSLVLNIALALALGLSIRVIHDRANAAVDNLFFRKRHENDTALRRFAREAAFFTDAATLRERIVTTILERTEATSAGVVPAQDLDPNDAAVVAMRAWHDPLDLTTYDTAIHGEYAFPMLAHGELAGVIVCGPKRTGEHFAPDEIDALQALAHGAGLALDGLQKAAKTNSPDVASLLGLVLARLDTLIESTAK